MSCNRSGTRTKTCSCKGVACSTSGGSSGGGSGGGGGGLQDLDQVFMRGVDLRNRGYRLLENFYDKCAGYNLRYCPLRGRVVRRNRPLRNTVTDLGVLAGFLLANFVVFLNILTKMTVHVYYDIRDMGYWMQSRCMLKQMTPEYYEHFRFQQFKEHDFSPPAPLTQDASKIF